jgi:DNA-directed RNA polymerase specialized sigma24 family protein
MDDFNQVYRRHFPGVLRFAEAQAGRRDVAEDLVAHAFHDLHVLFDALPPERLPDWLFDIVRTRAAEFWRKELADPRHAAWLSHPAQSPAERACLELHFVWGLSLSEISLRLGLAPEAVDAHLETGAARRDQPPVDVPRA